MLIASRQYSDPFILTDKNDGNQLVITPIEVSSHSLEEAGGNRGKFVRFRVKRTGSDSKVYSINIESYMNDTLKIEKFDGLKDVKLIRFNGSSVALAFSIDSKIRVS